MAGYLGIAVAAAAGALARYGLEQVLPSRNGVHYAGTLVVNIVGSFVLGVLMGALAQRFLEQPTLRAIVTVGFLSSFTTFSALAYQAVELAERGALLQAALYVSGTTLGGLAAAYGGLLLGRAL